MADTVLTRYGRDTSAVFDRLDEHCAGQAEQSFGGKTLGWRTHRSPREATVQAVRTPVPQPNNYQPRTIRAAGKLLSTSSVKFMGGRNRSAAAVRSGPATRRA